MAGILPVVRECVGDKGAQSDALCVVVGGAGAASTDTGEPAVRYIVLRGEDAYTGVVTAAQLASWLPQYSEFTRGRSVDDLVAMLTCRVKGVFPQVKSSGEGPMIWRDTAGSGTSLKFPVELVRSYANDTTAVAVRAVAATVATMATRLSAVTVARDALLAELDVMQSELDTFDASESADRRLLLEEMQVRLNAEKAKIRDELKQVGMNAPHWVFDEETDDEGDDDDEDSYHTSDDDAAGSRPSRDDSAAGSSAAAAVGDNRRTGSGPKRQASPQPGSGESAASLSKRPRQTVPVSTNSRGGAAGAPANAIKTPNVAPVAAASAAMDVDSSEDEFL